MVFSRNGAMFGVFLRSGRVNKLGRLSLSQSSEPAAVYTIQAGGVFIRVLRRLGAGLATGRLGCHLCSIRWCEICGQWAVRRAWFVVSGP